MTLSVSSLALPSTGATTSAPLPRLRDLELVTSKDNETAVPPPVPTDTLRGLTVLGYQGWFATPNDDDNNGWVHWGPLENGTGIMEDYWPELIEYGVDERHDAPGYFFPNGTQAQLFSSDNKATVSRHFQWMEQYGIDGVAIQRFGVEVSSIRHKRVLNYSLAAAAVTGRILYVEYDLSGMKEADIIPTISKDWAALVAQGVTKHPRYLHHGGHPVVGVFGFYMSRFSASTAAGILDIFAITGSSTTANTIEAGANPLGAFVAGSGQWFWWKANPSPAWSAVFYRMGSWSPWNMGNWFGGMADPHATTSYWRADAQNFTDHGVIWSPEIYPGCSTAHRDHKPPGGKGARIPRMKGAFLWEQFALATRMKVQTVFLGMFDELDEGTQILKVTNSPPTQATGDIGYEGMPSDVYLCFAGHGTAMVRGDIPYSATKPDCVGKTQPTIPTAVAGSTFDGRISDSTVLRVEWEPALALEGGGEIDHYEILVDRVIRRTQSASTTAIHVVVIADDVGARSGNATGSWRVRAVNTLGNVGGWSFRQELSSV